MRYLQTTSAAVRRNVHPSAAGMPVGAVDEADTMPPTVTQGQRSTGMRYLQTTSAAVRRGISINKINTSNDNQTNH
jgi:hypothetical protein